MSTKETIKRILYARTEVTFNVTVVDNVIRYNVCFEGYGKPISIRQGFLNKEDVYSEYMNIEGSPMDEDEYAKVTLFVTDDNIWKDENDDGFTIHFLIDGKKVEEFIIPFRTLLEIGYEPDDSLLHSQKVYYDAGDENEIIDSEADLNIIKADEGLVFDVVDAEGEVIKTCSIMYQDIADELCQ